MDQKNKPVSTAGNTNDENGAKKRKPSPFICDEESGDESDASVVSDLPNTSSNLSSMPDSMVEVQRGILKVLRELTKSMDRSRRDGQKMRKLLQGRGKPLSGIDTPGTTSTPLTYAPHTEVKELLFTKKDGNQIDLLSVTGNAPKKFAENLAREMFDQDEIILSIWSPQKKN